MLLRKTTTLRIIYVALFSLFFYYESSGEYVLILLFAATMDYFIGRAMGQSEDPRHRKRLLITSVCVNLGMLSYFKYFYFPSGSGADIARSDWHHDTSSSAIGGS